MDETEAGHHTVLNTQSCAKFYRSPSLDHFKVCRLRLLKRRIVGDDGIVPLSSSVGASEDFPEDIGFRRTLKEMMLSTEALFRLCGNG